MLHYCQLCPWQSFINMRAPLVWIANIMTGFSPKLTPLVDTDFTWKPNPYFLLNYLRWVRKLPLACPDPSHPGVGQVGPSVLNAFQENGDPFNKPSFCRLAASGHPYALRWVAYFPLMWPRLSQPGTGHLWEKEKHNDRGDKTWVWLDLVRAFIPSEISPCYWLQFPSVYSLSRSSLYSVL